MPSFCCFLLARLGWGISTVGTSTEAEKTIEAFYCEIIVPSSIQAPILWQ